MSSLLVFKPEYFRPNGNIHYCFTLNRKCRLPSTGMTSRPWAAAVPRLLRERGLKGIDLVKSGGLKRQGAISDIVHAPRPPEVMSLIKIAAAIQQAERVIYKRDPAPIPLWEFFVNDDQAALLRANEAHRASLVKPPEPSEDEKAYAQFKQWMEWQKASGGAEPPVHQAPRIIAAKKKR
jgi:hypothetical protein